MGIDAGEMNQIFGLAKKHLAELQEEIPTIKGNLIFLYGKRDSAVTVGGDLQKIAVSFGKAYDYHDIWLVAAEAKFRALMFGELDSAYEGRPSGACLAGGFAKENGEGLRKVFIAHGIGWEAEELLTLRVMDVLGLISPEFISSMLNKSKNPYQGKLWFS